MPIGILEIAPAAAIAEVVKMMRPNPDDVGGPEIEVELGPFRGLFARETATLAKRFPVLRRQWLSAQNAKRAAVAAGRPAPDPAAADDPLTDEALVERFDSAEVLPALIAAGFGAIGNDQVEAAILAKFTDKEMQAIAAVINRLTQGSVPDDDDGEGGDGSNPRAAAEGAEAPAAA